MSLFKGVRRAVKSVGRLVKTAAPVVAPFVAGPLGGALALAAGPGARYAQLPVPRVPTPPVRVPPRGPGGPGPRGPGGGPTWEGRPRPPGGAAPVPLPYPEDGDEEAPRQLRACTTPWGKLYKYGRRQAKASGWMPWGRYWVDRGVIVGCRYTRRMNPLNPRALRRAIRRVKGATKIAREVDRITGTRRRRALPAPRRAGTRAEAVC